MHEILIYTIIGFAIIYLLNIAQFIFGLTLDDQNIKNHKLIPVSIIIAVKNGEESLDRMLRLLSQQIYLGDMEFIIVDDNSTDNSQYMIESFARQDSRIKYVSSDSGADCLDHKKKALDAGIKSSRYEHLLFTDIDCIIQSNWVGSMVQYFSEDADYIVGHSYVANRASILNKFQRLDLLLLLFAAKSMIVLKRPWASIGQNQGYTKKLYNEVNGFKNLASYLQGDDSLFLQLAVKNGSNIIFNSDPNSYVQSRTELNWRNLLLQRGRWSGDANIMWKFNLSFYIMACALWIMMIGIFALLFIKSFAILGGILLAKIILELCLYFVGMKSFHMPASYIDFFIWFAIHPFYVLIMGIFSFFNFKWR